MLGHSTLAALAMLGIVSHSDAHTVGIDNGGWKMPRLIGGNGDQRKVGNYPSSSRSKTAAQQKRASKKARNVKRHKKHV